MNQSLITFIASYDDTLNLLTNKVQKSYEQSLGFLCPPGQVCSFGVCKDDTVNVVVPPAKEEASRTYSLKTWGNTNLSVDEFGNVYAEGADFKNL